MTPDTPAAPGRGRPGPVEILCDEIGFPFDMQLESPDMLVAFVRVLVSHISDMIGWRSVISRGFRQEPGFNTLEAMKPLKAVVGFLESPLENREARCAELHELTSLPDDGPCNRLIEMLSSCVSAIRFGLESPCHSRHAAEAASHIWGHKYGIRLFDEHTSRWQKDWTRTQFQAALKARTP